MTEKRAREIQAIIAKMKADTLNHLRILDGLVEEIQGEQAKAKRKPKPRSSRKKSG